MQDFQISQCKGLCSGESCQLKSCVSDPLSLSYYGGTWFRPTTKDMLYGLMDQYQDKMVKFVVGNTTGSFFRSRRLYQIQMYVYSFVPDF